MVGWIGDTGTPPAYKDIDNKWFYFYGDHTLRHIASTFLLPVHGKPHSSNILSIIYLIQLNTNIIGKEMHSMKEWTSSKVLYCIVITLHCTYTALPYIVYLITIYCVFNNSVLSKIIEEVGPKMLLMLLGPGRRLQVGRMVDTTTRRRPASFLDTEVRARSLMTGECSEVYDSSTSSSIQLLCCSSCIL